MEINEGFDIVGLIEENDEYNQMVDGIKTSFDDHFMQVRTLTLTLTRILTTECRSYSRHACSLLTTRTYSATRGCSSTS